MDEYSSFGSSLIVLPPTDRVLKVSPKRGPGDRKGRKKKEDRRLSNQPATSQKTGDLDHGTGNEDGKEAKGVEVDIVI